ncbi:hypothetical protein PQD71_gp184 [Kosakonia phage Kc263]|uniref:Uncharacterized protein n=1 Tax=Kosakonia phage Kc263 TaxID=2863194 RepID=A0AAE7WG21_9CAUD|nr:hypothetical protein PQD71_gp184 [Kosakonia phage Kc263]QYN80142.1 hypothetical protein [Kosakonia phage Kc263]
MTHSFSILKMIIIIMLVGASVWLWHISPYLFFASVYLFIGDMLKEHIHWSMNGDWIKRVTVHLLWPFWLIAFIVVALYREIKR